MTSTTSQRLIFMMTNHLEKLDRAFIGPGQIDLSLPIGNATLHQTLEFFQKCYEDPKLVIMWNSTFLLAKCVEITFLSTECGNPHIPINRMWKSTFLSTECGNPHSINGM
ncbi:hypothetical protein PSHT_13473 [Puccinia striiformis]|uniref:Uncharacterized protein n=2 Tax=Puccinia striiformis TaxID=27350 RepID=A0A2S4UQN1_9BASI|nr:hypothetical protein PSHT_13473 [Puccinia striiformis]POW05636.1 hypothetical protein PSTT_09575 [Puccinia striiformis]